MTTGNTPADLATSSGMPAFYLNASQVVDRYGVSTDTVWRWSRNGYMPKPVKLSPGSTRWRLSDLTKHEAQFSVGFTTFFAFPMSFFPE
jgi:prophage regulatory protein